MITPEVNSHLTGKNLSHLVSRFLLFVLTCRVPRVKLSKDQEHGKAYGRLVWNGRPKPSVSLIGGSLKKDWKLVATPDYKKFTGSDAEGWLLE